MSQSGHADVRYLAFLRFILAVALMPSASIALRPLISGLLRTTIREKLTFRDVATIHQIADWLKTTLPRTRSRRRRLAEIAD
jgi:hypothetical protein